MAVTLHRCHCCGTMMRDADVALSTHHDEDIVRYCARCAPIIKGGQGHTAADLRACAIVVVCILALAAGLVVALCVAGVE